MPGSKEIRPSSERKKNAPLPSIEVEAKPEKKSKHLGGVIYEGRKSNRLIDKREKKQVSEKFRRALEELKRLRAERKERVQQRENK